MRIVPSSVDAVLVLLLVLIVPEALRAFDIGAMLIQALEDCHENRARLAGWLGISEAQLSRVIAGTGPEHLSFDRATNLPERIWLRLLVLLGEHFGLVPPADTRAAHLARVTCRRARARLRRPSPEDSHVQVA
jgi:hypothetical protein